MSKLGYSWWCWESDTTGLINWLNMCSLVLLQLDRILACAVILQLLVVTRVTAVQRGLNSLGLKQRNMRHNIGNENHTADPVKRETQLGKIWRTHFETDRVPPRPRLGHWAAEFRKRNAHISDDKARAGEISGESEGVRNKEVSRCEMELNQKEKEEVMPHFGPLDFQQWYCIAYIWATTR